MYLISNVDGCRESSFVSFDVFYFVRSLSLHISGFGNFQEFCYLKNGIQFQKNESRVGPSYHNYTKVSDRQVWANSADPDQTVPREESV